MMIQFLGFMGGTGAAFGRQGHEVHYVLINFSGNIAVAMTGIAFLEILWSTTTVFCGWTTKIYRNYKKSHWVSKKNKRPSEMIWEVRKYQRDLSKSEAGATVIYVWPYDEQIILNDLPFYETGHIERKTLGEADIKFLDLIEQIQTPQNLRCGI